MKDINLLNDFYRPRKTVKIVSFLLIAFLAAAIFVYVGVFVPLKQKYQLSRMISGFSHASSDYEALEEEYARVSKEVDELKQKASGITPLIYGEKWSRIFELIEQAIPQGVALRSLSYDGNAVVLEGVAPDDVEIARFLVMLEKTGLFSEVSINRIYGEQENQIFLMNCKLDS